MAIITNVSFDSQVEGTVEVPCYVKVASVNANKEFGVATLEYLATDKNRLYKTSSIELPVDCSDSSTNFIRQAYCHLKTLKEFSSCSDC